MAWYLFALLAALFYAAQMLGFRHLQRSYPIPVYMAYIWLGAGALIGLFFIRSGEGLTTPNVVLILVAAAGSWSGMYAVNRAIRLQPNLGYVDAVGTLRLGLIYILSIALFNASFDPFRLAALAGIATGVILIVGVRQEGPQGTSNRRWVIWQLLAVMCFTLLFTCVRIATLRGVDTQVVTSLVMLFAGMFYVLSAIYQRQSLRPSRDLPTILLTIASSTIGNAAFFISLANAPNMAYTDAIVNLRLIILYVVALVMGVDRPDMTKVLGVVITFGCAALLG